MMGLPSPFRLVFNMALKATLRVRVGAVLLNKGYLSAGFNQTRSHPLMKRFPQRAYRGLHAEMHACLGVPINKLNGATIYIGRLRRNGIQGLARPCPVCYTFLRSCGIKKVVYTLDGQGYKEEKIV